ncbi:hypothetical protein I4U23_027139 [Adineta vaga]|nr:hypothetical protein I4U23_027139 [Adineta vaga]
MNMIRSPCLRPKQTIDSIEYEIDHSKFSLLLPSPSILITFPLKITLKQIQQLLSVHLFSTNENLPTKIHFELDGKILDEHIEFNSIIEKENLILFINNSQFKFRESKSIEFDIEILEKFRESLINRLPIVNGSRLKTSQHSIYPNESLDLLFDTLDGQINYLTKYLFSHFGEKHPFTIYDIQKQIHIEGKQWNEWETGIYRMHGDQNGTINIALASDWGAGTLESSLVARAMVNGLDLSLPQERATSNLPHYTIHLGDIYYVGLPSEIKHCCLGIKPEWADQGVRWPIGQYGSFTIPGNHELYSRGFGYWDYFLPNLGLFNPTDLTKPIHSQKTSYWLLENDQWRIIGLDTGYDSFSLLNIYNSAIKLPEKLIDWLQNIVGLNPEMNDKRGLIFFSHHQLISAWNEKPNTDFPSQIASLLPEGRTILFLWGHEHRLSFYEKQTIKLSNKTLTFYGRCCGNSGFPTLAKELPIKSRETKLIFYDDRLYHFHDNLFLPDLSLGYNGYATMKFINTSQISLIISYKTLSLTNNGQLTYENPTLLIEEQWSVDIYGNVVLDKIEPIDNQLTKVIHLDSNQNQSTTNRSSCCTTL